MPYQIDFETNASAITTTATGAGVFAVTKKKLLTSVLLKVQAWEAYVTSIVGQTVNFQLYGGGSVGGILAGATATVTIPAGALTAWEVGS